MRFTFFLLLFVFFCFFARATPSSYIVNITVESDIQRDAELLLAGRSPLEINDFSGPYSSRDVVDFLIIQKAIALGGLHLQFEMTEGDYDARIPKMLQHGLLLISFDSLWLSQIDDIKSRVYVTDAIIEKGDYFAGIYTNKKNLKALSITTLSDLKKLSFVSSKAWTADWKTLNKIAPARLVNERNWEVMVKMVYEGWVDVMLGPFKQTKPYRFKTDKYELIAVPNFKVLLNDSRHFVVSRKHPLGKRTFAALQKGLRILKTSGTLKRAYEESGFVNVATENWTVINPIKAYD